MANGKPTALLWSGGKDAVLAPEALRADPAYEVRALVTTLWMPEEVVTIHGIPSSGSAGTPVRLRAGN